MADEHCLELGIPERLHTDGRPSVGLDNPNEQLFRRYNLHTEASITASFRFGDTSVNRGGTAECVLSEPGDVLIDHKTGKPYQDCGVLAFDVGCLRSIAPDGCWMVDGVPGKYSLVSKHDPLRCNYAHVEIEVLKDGKKQDKIKPTLIKLAIRRHLQSRMKTVLPRMQVDGTLPVDPPTAERP